MAEDEDVVRTIRLPKDLYDRIVAWSESQRPAVTIQSAIRHVLVRGIDEIERKKKIA